MNERMNGIGNSFDIIQEVLVICVGKTLLCVDRLVSLSPSTDYPEIRMNERGKSDASSHLELLPKE
jgi:hypothetical protein